MVFAGILAGGVGSRMGAAMPKQFLDIAGIPVILRTVDAFCSMDVFDAIYLAVVADWEKYTRELLRSYSGPAGNDKRVRVICGGADRTGSLERVIDRLRADGGTDDDILVTHDGVRPFVSSRIIRDNISAARQYGCVGTAIPSADTILRSLDGHTISETPPRSELYRAQTPQSFRVGDYITCLSALPDNVKSAVTDVCGVFTRSGRSVAIVAGDERNIKITSPVDLLVAEVLASAQ